MEIFTIGGYNEVGKNMTVVNTGEDVFIFDLGVFLPAIVQLQESETGEQIYPEKKLRSIGALPDDLLLDKLGLREKVRAVFLGHAHLDHIGAAPYISYRYDAPLVGTPFTIEVLKKILDDDGIKIPNAMKTVNPNGSFFIRGKSYNYQVDFINITHSTIQTSMIALHTKEGIVLYANDFKLDNTPILGLPPNYDLLKKLSKEGIKVLIVDSLYSGVDRKTPSEKIARALVEEVLLTTKNENSAIFVTTFSSHIARLKSIVDFGKKLDRKIYFMGRSMKKYVSAAIDVGMCPFQKDIQIVSYKNQIDSILNKVEKDRRKSLIVCTGHQGEPGSIMDKLSRGNLSFSFKPGDNVIFSSKTIPSPINVENKEQLDKRLKKSGVRIFDNIHVSGHAGREDLRDLISLIHPEHIIPAHGSSMQLIPMIELAKELGYKAGKNCHLLENGQKIKL
ncbi:RNase J family beta-CASP ribonuclease [Candidatus Pacearchaeota archaeon]|jgi:ribonuclease J|nr:RNase J family beta-CASP ribonuclease [Candidatus Pacearchaeota archaeon]